MEKLLAYIALVILMLLWVAIYQRLPELQGLLVIIAIGGVALANCCPKAKEGR